MKKAAIIVVLICVAGGAAVALYLMFTGPRMRTQPKMTPYQAIMPAMPAGGAPITAQRPPVPSESSAAQLRNPLRLSQDTIEAGQLYYGYYCLFCHGDDGRGNGPVGRSYTPVPTDLTLPRVVNLSDGALYRAMLSGVGHEPVLAYVIDPELHWYLVSYMRHLQKSRTDANTVNTTNVVR
jgi:mono/diheme cytochrome c family protein